MVQKARRDKKGLLVEFPDERTQTLWCLSWAP